MKESMVEGKKKKGHKPTRLWMDHLKFKSTYVVVTNWEAGAI